MSVYNICIPHMQLVCGACCACHAVRLCLLAMVLYACCGGDFHHFMVRPSLGRTAIVELSVTRVSVRVVDS